MNAKIVNGKMACDGNLRADDQPECAGDGGWQFFWRVTSKGEWVGHTVVMDDGFWMDCDPIYAAHMLDRGERVRLV